MFDGREIERDARAREVAIHYIIQHPEHTLMLLPRKLLKLYLSDVDGIFYSMSPSLKTSGTIRRTVYTALRAIGELLYAVVVMLFAVSVPTILHMRSAAQKIGLFLLVYFTSIYVVFFGLARYHFPVMPWVATYAGIGAEHVLRRVCADAVSRVGSESYAGVETGCRA